MSDIIIEAFLVEPIEEAFNKETIKKVFNGIKDRIISIIKFLSDKFKAIVGKIHDIINRKIIYAKQYKKEIEDGRKITETVTGWLLGSDAPSELTEYIQNYKNRMPTFFNSSFTKRVFDNTHICDDNKDAIKRIQEEVKNFSSSDHNIDASKKLEEGICKIFNIESFLSVSSSEEKTGEMTFEEVLKTPVGKYMIQVMVSTNDSDFEKMMKIMDDTTTILERMSGSVAKSLSIEPITYSDFGDKRTDFVKTMKAAKNKVENISDSDISPTSGKSNEYVENFKFHFQKLYDSLFFVRNISGCIFKSFEYAYNVHMKSIDIYEKKYQN